MAGLRKAINSLGGVNVGCEWEAKSWEGATAMVAGIAHHLSQGIHFSSLKDTCKYQWQMTWVASNSSQIKKQKQWTEATVCHHYRIRSLGRTVQKLSRSLQPAAQSRWEPATQLS